MSVKWVTLLPIVGAVKQEVFHRFHGNALTQWAGWGLSLTDAKQVLVESDMSCAELEED